MRFQIRHRAGCYVARDADFERNVRIAQVTEQSRVVYRAYAVPDSLGADFESIPDRLRPVRFARVRGVA